MSDQPNVPTDAEDALQWERDLPWIPHRGDPEIYQGYGEDHAEFLGEDPFADTIEEGLL